MLRHFFHLKIDLCMSVCAVWVGSRVGSQFYISIELI